MPSTAIWQQLRPNKIKSSLRSSKEIWRRRTKSIYQRISDWMIEGSLATRIFEWWQKRPRKIWDHGTTRPRPTSRRSRWKMIGNKSRPSIEPSWMLCQRRPLSKSSIWRQSAKFTIFSLKLRGFLGNQSSSSKTKLTSVSLSPLPLMACSIRSLWS